MKCECPAAGMCTRRKCTIPSVHFNRCKAGQVETIDRLYDYTPERPMRPGISVSLQHLRPAGVGTVLKSKITGLLRVKSGGTCGCTTLASQMDQWGPVQCDARREYIIGRLMENKQMLSESLSALGSTVQAFAGWTMGTGLLDPALRAGADWLLTESINQAQKNLEEAAAVRKLECKTTVKVKRQFRTGNAFRHIDGPTRFIKSSQFQEDILLLLSKIPPDVTAIAGVARSGLSAATMLSMYLHLPMITIRQTMNDIVPTGNGWRLGGSKHVDPQGKILVVDDTVMTGNSIKAIAPLVERELGNAIYAAVYVNPLAARKPDIWAVDLQWPHLLEWNLFNSILSPSMAVDFDGILCRDCPPGADDDGPRYIDFIRNAQPLYVPRRVPIPLIVTARIEKYRAETEAWLNRHRISWHNLVMHPAANLRERQGDDIPAYKARHYMNWASHHRPAPGPMIFCESEDWQARRIAAISKMMTICPHTAGVY